MEIVNKINWHPLFIKKRQENWVKESNEWEISRRRTWGTPLPIWYCNSCNKHFYQDIELPKSIETPKILGFVDTISMPCKKCKTTMKR